MTAERRDTPIEAPFKVLEQALIDEFIRGRGHDARSLTTLPQAVREALLTEASVYASAKLSEVESRSQFVHEIHDVRQSREPA